MNTPLKSDWKETWKDRFSRLFVRQGFPIGISKYENKDGTDITAAKITDFFSSELTHIFERIGERVDSKWDELWYETRNGHSCVGRNTLRGKVRTLLSEIANEYNIPLK